MALCLRHDRCAAQLELAAGQSDDADLSNIRPICSFGRMLLEKTKTWRFLPIRFDRQKLSLRRLLALVAIYDRASRKESAQFGGGTRPSDPHDRRTASTYIFGAICPAEGKAASLILPWCNTEGTNLHRSEMSARVPLRFLWRRVTLYRTALSYTGIH